MNQEPALDRFKPVLTRTKWGEVKLVVSFVLYNMLVFLLFSLIFTGPQKNNYARFLIFHHHGSWDKNPLI